MIKFRQVVPIFWLFMVLFLSTVSAAEPKDTTATIASWNVKGIPLISVGRAGRIAAGITYLDAEVIVLTEVAPHNRVDDILVKLQELGADYFVEMPSQTSDLGIAIFCKNGVQLSDLSLIPGTDAGNPNLRKAVSAKIKIGEFDFILIGVHLKSARSGKSIRNIQCSKIAEFIEAETNGSEKDVIVVGDYNMVPRPSVGRNDNENFESMSPTGYLNFVTNAKLPTKGTHISNGRLGNFLDGYAVSDAFTNEYLDASIRVFPLHKTMRLSLRDYSNRVADHLPLVAKFDVVIADDD